MARKSIGQVVLIVILGAMLGSLLGYLIGLIIPEGVVKDFFLLSADLKFGPAELDLGIFAITFGFKIILNVVGFIGILIAIYLLRWY